MTREEAISNHPASGYPVYPVGTPVGQVSVIDRSIKMEFVCGEHKDSQWFSKDPYCSRWFYATNEQVDCGCPTDRFVLSDEYRPTRSN